MAEDMTKPAGGRANIPDTFYELLDAIRKKPGMYLGRKSLADFWSWLHGYDYAKLESRVARTPEEKEFDAFGAFICEKYRWDDVGGWARKIAYYHNDDANAFDEFFKLVDEFRASIK